MSPPMSDTQQLQATVSALDPKGDSSARSALGTPGAGHRPSLQLFIPLELFKKLAGQVALLAFENPVGGL